MMIIRTYALYERNKAVLAVMLVSACASAVSSLVGLPLSSLFQGKIKIHVSHHRGMQ